MLRRIRWEGQVMSPSGGTDTQGGDSSTTPWHLVDSPLRARKMKQYTIHGSELIFGLALFSMELGLRVPPCMALPCTHDERR